MNRLARSIRPTRVIVVGIVLLVGAALAVALRPRPVLVDLVTAERGHLRVTIDEEGQTRVRDRFIVSAPLAGRVLRIELQPGDRVEAGKTALATFLPTDPALLDLRTRAQGEARVKAAEAVLERARAERGRTQAELEFAEADLKRQIELRENDLISREELEAGQLRARTAGDAARAMLLQTQGGQAAAGSAITLRSPIDGVVLRRLRESEAVVPAGEPLLEIADPKRLEVVADLLSTDAVKVQPGAPVLIEQWGGERTLHGQVRLVEPYAFTKISALGVEEQRVNVIIDFADVEDAWEAMGDGFRVEVRVVIWEEADVLTVPTSSLFRQGDAWAVYAVRDGHAVLQTVDVGRRNGTEAQILSGLQAGDRVIAYPSDAIVDGVAVAERPS